MNNLLSFTLNNWMWMAILASFYWGFRSLFLFTRDPAPQSLSERANRVFFLRRSCKCMGVFFIGSYQFIYNFVGSLAGWCCLYALLVRVHSIEPATHLGAGNLGLFFLSFLGLTGHLPQATYGLVESFAKLGEAVLNKVSK